MLDDIINKIEVSIQDAINLKSNLNQSVLVLDIDSMTTPTIKHLMNNLCRVFEKVNYLEVGAYKGGTFCSAINNNPHVKLTS